MVDRRRSRAPLGLALVRLVIGLALVQQGWRWLGAEGLGGPALLETVGLATAGLPGPLAWYGDTVLLTNPDATAFLWRWATLLVGLAFLAGAFVRPVGWIGVFLAFHGWIFGPPDAARLVVLIGAALLACAVGDAGQVLGLDPALERRAGRKRSPF